MVMKDQFSSEDHIYIQLAALLRSQIEHGHLTGKIPGIRDLAQQYSVNVKTANKAVSLLVQDGHLFRLRGKGTFVADGTSEHDTHVLVGFILTDIVNPYFAHLAQALQDIAGEHNMTVIVNTTHGSHDALLQILDSYEKQNAQLLIVQGGVARNKTHFETITRTGIPVIGMHTRIQSIDDVWSDMRAGAQLVTDHLIKMGGAQVGYISGSDEPVHQTGRFQGYRDALVSKGFNVDMRFVAETDPTYRGGHNVVLDMIDSGNLPAALLFYNQIMAMGGVSALLSRGLKVPDDVAIASIDDSIDTSQMLVPTTTIDFSAEEAARQTLQLCRRRLTSPGAPTIHARIAPSLITRESSSVKLTAEPLNADDKTGSINPGMSAD
ncbi:MAG: hypothetical protein CL610_07730 [Anaerolineaceae bacterium]|nr:hypothetical protein [Anaerolineaceae bacterium]